MEHHTITYAECPRCLSSTEQDRWEAAQELFRQVKAVADESQSVRFHDEDFTVSVDWRVVESVEEVTR